MLKFLGEMLVKNCEIQISFVTYSIGRQQKIRLRLKLNKFYQWKWKVNFQDYNLSFNLNRRVEGSPSQTGQKAKR